jgi:hypothetical protein
MALGGESHQDELNNSLAYIGLGVMLSLFIIIGSFLNQRGVNIA